MSSNPADYVAGPPSPPVASVASADAAHHQQHQQQQPLRGPSASPFGARCFLRAFILVLAGIGSLFLLIALCRQAEVALSSLSSSTPAPFYNFNFWIVLFSAPIASWHVLQRAHHGSVPWFALAVACMAFIVLVQYSDRIGAQRNLCTGIPDDNSVARRNCNMTNLGFVGAFFVFVSQVMAFWVSTMFAGSAPPTWNDVVALVISIRGTFLGQQHSYVLEHKWDLLARLTQFILASSGAFFWLIEMAYFSNVAYSTPKGSLSPNNTAFYLWYAWVIVFACPILVMVSFQNRVHRAVPFISCIAAMIIFYTLAKDATPNAAFQAAFLSDEAHLSGTVGTMGVMNANFYLVGFVGLLFLWLSMIFFIALAAGDVYNAAVEQSQDTAQAADSRGYKMLKICSVVLILLGTALWIILLGKTAQFIQEFNTNNPACTDTSKQQCLLWYEWYWWQIVIIAPLLGILAMLPTPRPAVPFYSSLFATIMFYASQYYSNPPGNAGSSVMYIYGITYCEAQFYDESNVGKEDMAYCQISAVGYTGIIMMIVGLCMSVYLSASRLPSGKYLALHSLPA